MISEDNDFEELLTLGLISSIAKVENVSTNINHTKKMMVKNKGNSSKQGQP